MPLTEGFTTRGAALKQGYSCIGPPKQGHMEKRKKAKPTYVAALKFDESQVNRQPSGAPGSHGGEFAPKSIGGGTGKSKGGKVKSVPPNLTASQREMQRQLREQKRKRLHKVKTPEEGVELILKGERVELQDISHVHTVLHKLGDLAIQAKKDNKDAKNWDPCLITVKGTSLFCTEKIKTREFPHGVPRIEMPQFKSKNPTPGSEADKRPRKNGEVDGSQAFLDHLQSMGVKTEVTNVPARKLKASQAEMEGTKVAGMMLNPNVKPKEAKIWVSKDNYVIDGHHTWAAAVGRDAEDGNLDNDMEMKVIKVDMLMSDIYHVSVPWTKKFGLPAAGVKKYDWIMRFKKAS